MPPAVGTTQCFSILRIGENNVKEEVDLDMLKGDKKPKYCSQ
jgi:hypothetical protein